LCVPNESHRRQGRATSLDQRAKHLHRYVAEATWRFNRRDVKDAPRMAEFLGRVNERLMYEVLIAK
jgi:hypothetical protein